jgi:hypothetical protein
MRSRSRGLLSSGGIAVGFAPVIRAPIAETAEVADVIPADTTTPLFNTSRLVHLRIFRPSCLEMIAY